MSSPHRSTLPLLCLPLSYLRSKEEFALVLFGPHPTFRLLTFYHRRVKETENVRVSSVDGGVGVYVCQRKFTRERRAGLSTGDLRRGPVGSVILGSV